MLSTAMPLPSGAAISNMWQMAFILEVSPYEEDHQKDRGDHPEEMDAIGGQEILFPVALPGSLREESGRFESVGEELLRFKDRNGSQMVLGMTHEEASVQLVRTRADLHQISLHDLSYRDKIP